jgi:splicing factor 3A subunit 1
MPAHQNVCSTILLNNARHLKGVVHRAGTEVEQKILAGPKNVKFNFINPTDPYHKYYKYKILESKEGAEAAQAAFAAEGAAVLTGAKQPGAPAAVQPSPVEEEAPTVPLVKPDDEKYTVHVPPGLTLQELDIIKLTAQYVARNGKEFLRGLRSREETKREFMFLKEAHSLNTFFKRLTDAYSSVLLDSKEALQRLNSDANDMSAILTRCELVPVLCGFD